MAGSLIKNPGGELRLPEDILQEEKIWSKAVHIV